MSDFKRVDIGGLTLGVRLWGDGPRCGVILHGFPDTADGMAPVAERLAAAGYTVAAPYLRGYAPSDLAPDGRYDIKALSRDVLELLKALDFKETCLIGHDWGAAVAYACAAQDVSRISKVVALSVPPLRAFSSGLCRSPRQWFQSRYMGLFQFGRLAEQRVAKDNFAYLDDLWSRWSPNLTPPPGHLDSVKSCLSAPGSLRAALSYYRALLPRPGSHWRENWQLANQDPRCPVHVMVGLEDGCISPRMFDGVRFPVTFVPDAGHFLVLESPDVITEVCLQG